ncbi:MAG: short chain dehydrogenase [Pseudanabaena sp. CRU_2_10]|nr:short chain dehydrogenase [Pseudanabaena sp. CRU_2_10]
MKIIVVGATGTIGRAIVDELSPRHDLVKVGNQKGDVNVDITSMESIVQMYETVGAFDALVSATGKGYFGDFDNLNAAEMEIGIQSKLMGQINLVLIGRNYISDRGSFTLTSGILSQDPVPGGAALSTINAGIDGFAIGAAIDMSRGIRINSVSPGVVLESMEIYAPYFRGHDPVPVARVARAFSKSVEGRLNGQVFRVY